MKVAWIGMGRIGKQMALRVAASGHAIVGHARNPAKHHDLVAAGGRVTPSLPGAVADAAIVCVNVYDEPQLRDALFASGGLGAMASGAALVIHSTVGPALIHEIAAARNDIRLLDAPFSGTDANAAAGTIALMVGGKPSDLAMVQDVLATYADHIDLMGPTGAGAITKLVNNALFGAQMLLARDALRVLAANGIDEPVAVRTLGHASGGSFALGQFGGGVDAERRMAGIWPYIEKDVGVARAAAAQSGFDLGMLDIATRPFIRDAS